MANSLTRCGRDEWQRYVDEFLVKKYTAHNVGLKGIDGEIVFAHGLRVLVSSPSAYWQHMVLYMGLSFPVLLKHLSQQTISTDLLRLKSNPRKRSLFHYDMANLYLVKKRHSETDFTFFPSSSFK